MLWYNRVLLTAGGPWLRRRGPPTVPFVRRDNRRPEGSSPSCEEAFGEAAHAQNQAKVRREEATQLLLEGNVDF